MAKIEAQPPVEPQPSPFSEAPDELDLTEIPQAKGGGLNFDPLAQPFSLSRSDDGAVRSAGLAASRDLLRFFTSVEDGDGGEDQPAQATETKARQADGLHITEGERLRSVVAAAMGLKELTGLTGKDTTTGLTGHLTTKKFNDTDGSEFRLTSTFDPAVAVVEKGNDIYILGLDDKNLHIKISSSETGTSLTTNAPRDSQDTTSRTHAAVTALRAEGERFLREGKKEEAERSFRAALTVAAQSEKHGLSHPGYHLQAHTLGMIGRSYLGLENTKSALKYMEQSAALYEAQGDSSGAMDERQMMAYVYFRSGDPAKAAENAELASKHLEKLEADGRETPAKEGRFGMVHLYLELGMTDKATGVLSRSLSKLRDQERVFGNTNQDVIDLKDRLALNFLSAAQESREGPGFKNPLYVQARSLLRENEAVMEDLVKSRGPDDAAAKRMRDDLRSMWKVFGDGGLVERRMLERPFLEATLPKDEKRLGTDDPEVMKDRQELAVIYSFLNRPDDAARLMQKNIDVIEQDLKRGSSHPDLIPYLEDLMWNYSRNDREADEKRIQARLKSLGSGTQKY